ncbi:MAG: UDP-N-acetylmuramoyl-tripeptide--D-alanyl-D-alanine ligase [Clostridiales bacterium]|nr:UDP-N-acetylmuramoyl-tripeptide--D-alanyl-D-alanine ligase [Clostridiales bacterium]
MLPTSVQNFSQLFTGDQVLVYLSFSVLNTILLFSASMKFILVLQQCGYRGKRYFKWLSNKDTPYMSRLMLLCMLAFLFFCVLNLCFTPVMNGIFGDNGETVASYVGLFSYAFFVIMYINTEKSVNAKVPLKRTKRLVRLCITYFIVLFALSFGLITLINLLAFIIGYEAFAILRLSLVCVMPILIPYMLFIAYAINEPLENAIKKYYIRRAVHKLENTDVLKIGITGSYGKTSVKVILRTILSQKYRVLATPESYNTPLGIAIAVKQLDSTHDIFIAEMGARSKGDIKELADMVKPQYAVLTGVNNQHLESFRTIENIKNTKFELFETLNEKGVGFFSADNENTVELMARFNGEKYSAGINGENLTVKATDIKTDSNGMKFTLNFNGEKAVKCSSVLLGKHNVSNICLAAAVAYKIGLTPKEIASGINRIKSIEHRLELMPNNKKIVLIDDSYNGNENGVEAAMEVLDSFDGRKIVLTPGLVELGKAENLMNMKLGKILSSHADIVIIIGKHNAEMLINGLIEGGMPRENIKFAKSLSVGNELLNSIMQEGDVVLFENDLPDNYN